MTFKRQENAPVSKHDLVCHELGYDVASMCCTTEWHKCDEGWMECIKWINKTNIKLMQMLNVSSSHDEDDRDGWLLIAELCSVYTRNLCAI